MALWIHLAPVPAQAGPVIYSYTGAPFTHCGWGCGPESPDLDDPDNVPADWASNYLLATLIFLDRLPADMAWTDVSASPSLLAWSVRDALGYFSMSSANGDQLLGIPGAGVAPIYLSTDGDGNILDWSVTHLPEELVGINGFGLSSTGVLCSDCDTFIADGLVYDNRGPSERNVANSTVGEWSVTAVPEPTSLLLLGTGTAAMLARARRRRNSTAL